MDAQKPSSKADRVDQAFVDIRRATTRLIKLLADKDDLVRQRAAAALAASDPPPIPALTDVLIQAKDKALRLRIIAVLSRVAEVEQIRVVLALGSAYLAIKDTDVRLAMIDAMVGMKMYFELAAQTATPGPAPPEGDPSSDTVGPVGDEVPEDGLPAWGRQRPRSGV